MSELSAYQSGGEGSQATAPATAIGYEGRVGEVAAIALQNALFNLITLGFYRFWAKTRLRRYIWGNIEYRGERLEYTGRGGELFLGFLIAIGILLALVFAFEFAIEAAGGPLTVEAGVIQMIQSVVIIFLVFVAIFRARRYRLSRSQWRGIRGGQSGSAVTFALKAMLWGLVLLLTVGLAYPVFRTRLMAYQVENTWFGSERAGFTGRAGELIGGWCIAWLLLIPSLGLSYVWYRVREFRYFASNCQVGPLSFASDLHTGRIVLIFLTNFFVWAAVTFLFAAVGYALFTGGASPPPDGAGEEAVQLWLMQSLQNPGLIVLLLLYLVASGLIRTVVWLQPMVAEIATSVSVAGEMDFARLAQSSQDMPGRGEGLAEALDVGSI